MNSLIQYIKEPNIKNDEPFQRGYIVDESLLNIVLNEEPSIRTFGKSSKDIVEFSVYSTTNDLLYWSTIQGSEDFNKVNFNFFDYNDDNIIGSVDVVGSRYLVKDNKLILSFTDQLKKLGATAPSAYKVGISMRNDVVGSSESSSFC